MAKNASVEDYKARLERVARAAAVAGYNAAENAATEIGRSMKAAVPRRTGKLAESIRLETDAHNGRVFIKAGGDKTQTENHTDYAMHQEYGTSRMPANPFFWPAWRLGRKTARRRIDKAMKDAIEGEMQK
jgi:HK97 gp10 family phage protein